MSSKLQMFSKEQDAVAVTGICVFVAAGVVVATAAAAAAAALDTDAAICCVREYVCAL
jgi:hypothetical protein